ncbi:putative Steroid 5-alpha reductase C-terminal domain-containing protein [Seiridium unicorne]|uniref:Steroid 5-alpha reductase C-terminal domain-containing protein n=1 Tax=Seiridium unicorne TaxID=138068 RepID=A0ABR2V1Z8_9PEZI
MAGTIHVLDDYYLAITILITIAYQIFLQDSEERGDDLASMVLATAILSNLKVKAIEKNTGKDDRFDDKRNKFFPFLGLWLFRMVWVWTVSLPVMVLISPNVQRYPQASFGTGRDITAIVLFAVEFIKKSVSDVQRSIFRQRNDESAIFNKGFFSWSRHPNYFGEIIQFAIYVITVSAAANGYVQWQVYKALYAMTLGPFFLAILLMFVSGLPLSERPGAKKRSDKGMNWYNY